MNRLSFFNGRITLLEGEFVRNVDVQYSLEVSENGRAKAYYVEITAQLGASIGRYSIVVMGNDETYAELDRLMNYVKDNIHDKT